MGLSITPSSTHGGLFYKLCDIKITTGTTPYVITEVKCYEGLVSLIMRFLRQTTALKTNSNKIVYVSKSSLNERSGGAGLSVHQIQKLVQNIKSQTSSFEDGNHTQSPAKTQIGEIPQVSSPDSISQAPMSTLTKAPSAHSVTPFPIPIPDVINKMNEIPPQTSTQQTEQEKQAQRLEEARNHVISFIDRTFKIKKALPTTKAEDFLNRCWQATCDVITKPSFQNNPASYLGKPYSSEGYDREAFIYLNQPDSIEELARQQLIPEDTKNKALTFLALKEQAKSQIQSAHPGQTEDFFNQSWTVILEVIHNPKFQSDPLHHLINAYKGKPTEVAAFQYLNHQNVINEFAKHELISEETKNKALVRMSLYEKAKTYVQSTQTEPLNDNIFKPMWRKIESQLDSDQSELLNINNFIKADADPVIDFLIDPSTVDFLVLNNIITQETKAALNDWMAVKQCILRFTQPITDPKFSLKHFMNKLKEILKSNDFKINPIDGIQTETKFSQEVERHQLHDCLTQPEMLDLLVKTQILSEQVKKETIILLTLQKNAAHFIRNHRDYKDSLSEDFMPGAYSELNTFKNRGWRFIKNIIISDSFKANPALYMSEREKYAELYEELALEFLKESTQLELITQLGIISEEIKQKTIKLNELRIKALDAFKDMITVEEVNYMVKSTYKEINRSTAESWRDLLQFVCTPRFQTEPEDCIKNLIAFNLPKDKYLIAFFKNPENMQYLREKGLI